MSQRMSIAAKWTMASVFLCLLVGSCSRGTGEGPQIVLSKVPDADTGGSRQTGALQGRATVKTSRQIVFCIKSQGRWWVEPLAQNPFPKIETDSTWKNEIQLGTGYAVLLVNRGYNPLASVDELPKRASGVRAIAVVRGLAADASTRTTLHLSAYHWIVRTAPPSRPGGLRNTFNKTLFVNHGIG